MIDVVLALYCFGLLVLGLRRPFIWVLAYIYIDIVQPQKIGWIVMPSLKISLITFILAFSGWLLFDNKKGSRLSFRQLVMISLLLYCGFTTFTIAAFPELAALKWDWAWKTLLFAIFLPFALRTPLRLEAATIVVVLSIAAIAISGSMKTLLGGGGYGVLVTLVNEDSGIYEGSIASTAAISTIPLLWWVVRHGTLFPAMNRYVVLFAVALTFALLLLPVGYVARTGLVCIVVLGVLLMRTVRHRFVFAGLAALVAVAAIPFLPATVTDRMSTITNHEADESASTRIQVWQWTLDYVEEHPLGGGFDAYMANSFTYHTTDEVEVGGSTMVKRIEVKDEGRAYHSSYFEMLGEQGYPGLALWLLLQVTGLISMERLRRKGLKSDDPVTKRWGALANALQQSHIVTLVGALFVGVAYQPYMLIVISLQIALSSQSARFAAQQREADRRERMKARRERAQAVAAGGRQLPA